MAINLTQFYDIPFYLKHFKLFFLVSRLISSCFSLSIKNARNINRHSPPLKTPSHTVIHHLLVALRCIQRRLKGGAKIKL